MKIILEVEVDEVTGREYEKFTPENKQEVRKSVSQMLKEATNNALATKLRKLVEDIRHESSCKHVDPEILYEIVCRAD